jgi:hypothetical protein
MWADVRYISNNQVVVVEDSIQHTIIEIYKKKKKKLWA